MEGREKSDEKIDGARGYISSVVNRGGNSEIVARLTNQVRYFTHTS